MKGRAVRLRRACAVALVLALPLAAVPARAADDAAPPAEINEYTPKDVYIVGDPLPMARIDSIPGARDRPRMAFIGCPILMDSEPTPLWLIEHEGETYFLRAQQNLSADVHHPQLMHEVLVEGVVSDEPRVAGGKVLNPLQISVMRELNPACSEKRPAQTGVGVQAAKRPPGPGPSGENRDAANQVKQAMRDKLNRPPADYVADPVPRERRVFDVPYTFDSDYTWAYRTGPLPAAEFARDLDASLVEVHVYRGSVRLDDGSVLPERADVVDDRRDKIREILEHYFIPRERTRYILHREPAPADGIGDHANRFVQIIVHP